VDGLADRLARLARDPELRRRFGVAGREKVVPRYRVSRLVGDIDELYRELLAAA
jgi:glycosyltransferase involved in cell wall biosynthesis